MFRKKFDIEFYSLVDGIEKISPIQKASKLLPSWWKNINVNDNQTFLNSTPINPGNIKKCPGISDFLLDGYILTAWTDIYIDPSDEHICEFKTSIDLPGAIINQITESVYKPYLSDGALSTYRHALQITPPWLIKTKRGYSIQLQDPFFFFNKEFACSPGIVDTDIIHKVSPVIFIKSDKPFIIPFNTPLAIIKPLKREKLTYNIIPYSRETEKLNMYSNLMSFCKFSTSSIYNLTRKNRCPFS